MSSKSFFQSRSSASVMPIVMRAAQPTTPHPVVMKPPMTPSAIVLAWDNVLFPIKWMMENAGLSLSNKKSYEETKCTCLNNPFTTQALSAIEQQVIDLLALATTKAPVFILSDQATATIDAFCSAFFPRLKVCLTNANGRVHIMGSTSPNDRAAWKLGVLQHICSASMRHQSAHATVHGSNTFKVLVVSADDVDHQVAARVQAAVARVGTIQTLALHAAMENGSPLSLVDFHKQLRAVTSALEMQK